MLVELFEGRLLIGQFLFEGPGAAALAEGGRVGQFLVDLVDPRLSLEDLGLDVG